MYVYIGTPTIEERVQLFVAALHLGVSAQTLFSNDKMSTDTANKIVTRSIQRCPSGVHKVCSATNSRSTVKVSVCLPVQYM